MFYKVKTKLSELTIEADQYRFADGVAVFFVNHQLTNVLMDVESVEPACKFKVGDSVNCQGCNGVVINNDESVDVEFGGKTVMYFNHDGTLKGIEHAVLQHGQVHPSFKLHDRVVVGHEKGVVTGIKDRLFPIEVTFDSGLVSYFTPDGRSNLSKDVTLSLVTPQWTALELEYYNALIKAGASESAADYAVTKTLTGQYGLTNNFQRSLMGGFLWMENTWGQEYWENISAAIQTPPSVKLQRLFSDKTPEIGDLVIAGDYKDDFYLLGTLTKVDDDAFPYFVRSVGDNYGSWYKYARCLNL